MSDEQSGKSIGEALQEFLEAEGWFAEEEEDEED